jgi:hypothetical protein
MGEKKVWLITGAGRGLGVATVKAEPSHIHVPRPGRDRAVQISGRWSYAAAEPSHIHVPRPGRASRDGRHDEGAAPFELPEPRAPAHANRGRGTPSAGGHGASSR